MEAFEAVTRAVEFVDADFETVGELSTFLRVLYNLSWTLL